MRKLHDEGNTHERSNVSINDVAISCNTIDNMKSTTLQLWVELFWLGLIINLCKSKHLKNSPV
jgi:hypothetical protein